MSTAGDEIDGWLRLTQTPGIGAATVRRLLGAFGLPQAVLAQPYDALRALMPETAARALLAAPDAALARQIELTRRWVDAPGHHCLTLADAAYPQALLALDDPPPLLYVTGDPDRLSRPSLAVVGSRHASAQGLDNARAFAHTLGDAGLTVVSGLAAGIDGAAHEGALGTPGGTVAVIGTGIDVVYPARHRALAHRIAAEGALVSELPLGAPARAHHFPRRNRLIAALCHGTLVIEAALQSGSLITARLAAELGREVFAIPGSIHSPLAKGCHRLIQQGAKLMESAQDVYDELHGLPTAQATRTLRRPAAPNRRAGPSRQASGDALLDALGYDPVSAERLCERTGLGAADVQRRLFEHELDGAVLRLPGGLYQRAAGPG